MSPPATAIPVELELHLGPSGPHSDVLVNGHSIGRHVLAVTVHTPASGATVVTLHCLNRRDPSHPLVIRGHFLVDEGALPLPASEPPAGASNDA